MLKMLRHLLHPQQHSGFSATRRSEVLACLLLTDPHLADRLLAVMGDGDARACVGQLLSYHLGATPDKVDWRSAPGMSLDMRSSVGLWGSGLRRPARHSYAGTLLSA